jgi:predicted secreted protein
MATAMEEHRDAVRAADMVGVTITRAGTVEEEADMVVTAADNADDVAEVTVVTEVGMAVATAERAAAMVLRQNRRVVADAAVEEAATAMETDTVARRPRRATAVEAVTPVAMEVMKVDIRWAVATPRGLA